MVSTAAENVQKKKKVMDAVPVWNRPEDALHHGKVLPVVVRLKQRHAQVELKEDAADGPNVARLRPSQFCIGDDDDVIIMKIYERRSSNGECVYPK